MFFKLAVRNVKRQFGNYLIYFMTVALTVALLFAINGVIYSEKMQFYTSADETIRDMMVWFVAMIGFVVAFVLSYATSFMLKLRKREFGIYLTLGMSRRDICTIFIYEPLFICLAALGIGLLCGIFLHQGLMALAMNLMKMEFTIAPYSKKGLCATISIVAGIFLMASVVSLRYLKRVSIYDLVYGERRVEKSVKHPLLWFLCTLAALAALIGSLVFLNQFICESLQKEKNMDTAFLLAFGIFAISVMVFHMGLAKSIMSILLQNKRLKARGSNTFVFRQLSDTLSSNAVMLGMLAFLMTFAVIGTNVSFLQKASREESLIQVCPYDIMYCKDLITQEYAYENSFSMEKGERIIEEYCPIVNQFSYAMYTTGRRDFYQYTQWGKGFDGLTDSFMALSDFNAFITPLGYEPLKLQDTYFIVSIQSALRQIDWEQMVFCEGAKEYHFQGISEAYPRFHQLGYYFFVVVPDAAVDTMQQSHAMTAYNLADKKFNGYALMEALSYIAENPFGGNSRKRCDYSIQEFGRITENSTSAFFVVGALFIAAVFLLMALAILALKILSNLAEDKCRYKVLYHLGAGEQEQSSALFWQTFSFFILPFVFAALMSVPIGLIGVEIALGMHLETMAKQVPVIAGAIAVGMTALYIMYYVATYLLAKRVIISAEQ